LPSGLGEVRGAIIRARTLANGVFDIVIADRGIVLVPLRVADTRKAAAFVLGGFQGGLLGHHRGGAADARRRENYLAGTADELARHYLSYRTVRRADVAQAHVWDRIGTGKLRLDLVDGEHVTLRWERAAN